MFVFPFLDGVSIVLGTILSMKKSITIAPVSWSKVVYFSVTFASHVDIHPRYTLSVIFDHKYLPVFTKNCPVDPVYIS
jgi:hypothetical protein